VKSSVSSPQCFPRSAAAVKLALLSPAPTAGTATPVVLFVYRRHQQLPRTLACLRDAGARHLYVFSDGPADQEAAPDVERVRALLGAIDWADPVIVSHADNLGLSASIRTGLDYVFEHHETAIVIEDDVCVAPEFCRYAERALAHYAGAERVAGLTGLRLPFDRRVLASYEFDVFLSPRFSSWAWATWRARWRRFSFDADELRRRLAASEDFRPWRAGADLPAMIHDAVLTETLGGSWDVFCATNMLLEGSGFVTPTWNMVENSGLEEGSHAAGPSGLKLDWERDQAPAIDGLRFAPAAPNEQILRAYRRFFNEAAGGPLARLRTSVAGRRATRRIADGRP
jgi:hypothetical protein